MKRGVFRVLVISSVETIRIRVVCVEYCISLVCDVHDVKKRGKKDTNENNKLQNRICKMISQHITNWERSQTHMRACARWMNTSENCCWVFFFPPNFYSLHLSIINKYLHSSVRYLRSLWIFFLIFRWSVKENYQVAIHSLCYCMVDIGIKEKPLNDYSLSIITTNIINTKYCYGEKKLNSMLEMKWKIEPAVLVMGMSLMFYVHIRAYIVNSHFR